ATPAGRAPQAGGSPVSAVSAARRKLPLTHSTLGAKDTVTPSVARKRCRCRRRLEEWARRGLFERALVVLQTDLAGADRLDWSRVIVDASLVDAKKGARRSRARSMAVQAAATTSP